MSHEVDDYSTETLERGTILVHNDDCEKFLEGTSIYRVFWGGGDSIACEARPVIVRLYCQSFVTPRMLRRRHRNKRNERSE